MKITGTNITCVRGARHVLENVCFDVSSTECLILRGPNGVGKSTLLRVLAGLSQPASGTHNISPDDVAFSGHLDAVKFQLTVEENIQFWTGVYGTQAYADTLRNFGLEQFAARPAANLSAGQKRRLGLARLTLSKRKIWLMDEPTTSLDTENTKLIAQCIQNHCAADGIAILSTHLNLDIPNAKILDLSEFMPTTTKNLSPFLEGEF